MTRRMLGLSAAFAAMGRTQTRGFAKRKTIEQFFGAWELVTYTRAGAHGAREFPFGEDAIGRLAYDPAGRMYAQLMRRDRPKFASGTMQGTPEEIRAAFEGYLGYYGRYEIRESENLILHHVQVCWFPNWVGTALQRHYRFSGEQLVLTAPDNGMELVWTRAR